MSMPISGSTATPWFTGKDQLVVGTAGFKGAPGEDGVVEIAYGVVPVYQGQGLATEAAQALTAFAFDTGRVRRVRAHTLPTPNASTRVLANAVSTSPAM